jgi:hypothetical protein
MVEIMVRSCWRRRLAIVQPSPGGVRRSDPSGPETSCRKTSQNGEAPLIRRRGATLTPGPSMSKRRKLMPSCFAPSSFVRTRQNIQAEESA